MHTEFLPLFADPVSGEPLGLTVESANGDRIISGCLSSSRSKYPIIRGVPRFVSMEQPNYARSFGYQWLRWSRVQFESENIGTPMAGHTRAMWERITGRTARRSSLDGQTVLDIGCGAGRFIEIARQAGARVVGVDYSIAVEVAAEAFAGDDAVCICQADALRLPFKSEVFDGAFSIGVLHHTPSPEQGVEQALRVLREGGWFGMNVYSNTGYYNYPNVQFWRKLFNITWPVLRHYPPLLYSYIAGYVLRPLARIPGFGRLISLPFPFVRLPDARWSVLDTFDSVTPSFQSAHETYEVHQWLKRAGFRDIEAAAWGPNAVTARR